MVFSLAMLPVVTLVHPLAENPRTPPKPRKGNTRAAQPETPATAPEAAAWIDHPDAEPFHPSTLAALVEQWRSEPRWTPPEETNS